MSPGAGGLARWWESLGVCAGFVCVLYSGSLWVGRSRSLRTLPPPHQPPGKGGGVREEGGGAAAPAPAQCGQRAGRPDSVSHKQAQSSGFLCCVSLVWCGSPLPPDPDGSSHVRAHTDTHTQTVHTHRRAHAHTHMHALNTHTQLCPQAEASVCSPACLCVCFGYLGSALSRQARWVGADALRQSPGPSLLLMSGSGLREGLAGSATSKEGAGRLGSVRRDR